MPTNRGHPSLRGHWIPAIGRPVFVSDSAGPEGHDFELGCVSISASTPGARATQRTGSDRRAVATCPARPASGPGWPRFGVQHAADVAHLRRVDLLHVLVVALPAEEATEGPRGA